MRFAKKKKRFLKNLKRLFKRFHHHRRKDPRMVYSLIAFAVFMLAVVGYAAYASHISTPGHLVTIHDYGKDHVILTHAATVRDALQDADIAIDPKDDVEPALGSQITSTDSAIIIYRARLVLVIDGAEHEKALTPAQSPNEIAKAAGLEEISSQDQTTLTKESLASDGVDTILTIKRAAPAPIPPKLAFAPTAQTLTKNKGAQIYVDGSGVAHRETYYDLPMNIVIGACGGGGYTIRADGAKVDKEGYILVAASLANYPKCTVVETSMGPGKVYDTGGFALRYPHGFDLATDWTNYDGQ
jgi:hypothetical protein